MFKKKIAMALALLGAAAMQTSAKPLVLVSPQDYELYDISPNGKWACGCYSDYSYNYYGFRWNLETNEVELLSTSEESIAWSIANDGTVAGTFQDRTVFSNGTPVEMAGYYKDGSWHHVEVPANVAADQGTAGHGYGISTDGHYMSGCVSINGTYAPVIWKDGKVYKNYYEDQLDAVPYCISPDGQAMAGWSYPTAYGNRCSTFWTASGEKKFLTSCEMFCAAASNFSPDGSKIVFWGGYKSDNEADEPQVASIYDVATGNIGYITTPGEVGIYVYDITNDGTVLGAKEFDAGGFIWKNNTFIDADDYLEELGVDYEGTNILRDSTTNVPYIIRAASISEDQKRIGIMYYDTEGAIRSMVVMTDAENGEMAPAGLTAKQLQGIKAVNVSWKQSVIGTAPDGYNVYRNGTKVNSEVLTTTTYYDKVDAAGTYSYTVSALYGTTEKSSDAVSVNVTEKGVSTPQTLYARQKGINGARLQWSAPESNFINRTYYSADDATLAGFGTSGTTITFEGAIKFDKDEMALYAGNKLRKVQFYPMDSTATGLKVNVYTYDAANSLKLLYTQDITQKLQYNALNTITLSTPVSLPDGDLVVAIQATGNTPNVLGIDFGNTTAGYTDLVRKTSENDFYSMKTASSGTYLMTWYINALLGADGTADNIDELTHYTVYADGNNVGTTTSLSHAYASLTDGSHTLGVSATFADGRTSDIATADVLVATQGVDDLTATINGSSAVDFAWTAPLNDDATYVSYASGSAKTGPKGPSDNNYGFLAGAIYDAAKLKGYDGYTVKTFRFYPTADAEFTFYVLKNGVQIYEQEVYEYELNQWNTIEVATPFTIDETAEYYLALDCFDVTPEEAPLAIDGTSPYKNYSDIYSLDEGATWSSISETGMYGNWMMGMELYDPEAASVAVEGYDFYLDGEKVNSDKLTATTLTRNFTDGETQEHTAHVNVYYSGVAESVVGNTVTFTLSALAGIDEATVEKLSLHYGDNFVTIDGGAESIEAFAADGSKVSAADGSKLNITSFTPGVYVIKAKTANGTLTRKIEVSK